MGKFEILDTDEPLAKRIERHAFDRLIMLSDGVFAIAITLLALEIKPPAGLARGGAGLLRALEPSLLGFAISFIVVSAYWAAHRRIFARLRRVDGPTTVLTLLLLALVVLQPVSLESVITYGSRGEALLFYIGMIGLIGVAQAALWAYVALIAKLIDPSLSLPYRITHLVGSLVTPLVACSLSFYAANQHSPVAMYAAFALVGIIVFGRRYLLRRFGG